ncbi:uncharacterized protein Nmag_3624 (plasmid) [Natrialba magadii ATCC 43099]|uniref:Uncharacterized protein n=1 Tax=Natrialba magadii (strain ATCC 43099 / DSM 3394 / CCM 3739 / CIP 104546 / IAM 13178 / JCM 8861 / NBRC 102185 / NCIMB 2190 / MS3) TaxID=547559 RepID=D3T0R4_NATMM|nr:hypothetical protein [Natrialba magadii]ADD07173.1 uncharacterized protein Nmag_3624 [Natrialba magadii ATCC 43099]
MRNERSRGNEHCPLDDGIAGQQTGHENSADAPATRRSVEFPAATPTRDPATHYDAIHVAGDDATLFEPTDGGRDA